MEGQRGEAPRKDVGEEVGVEEARMGREQREGVEGVRKRNGRCTARRKWEPSHLFLIYKVAIK